MPQLLQITSADSWSVIAVCTLPHVAQFTDSGEFCCMFFIYSYQSEHECSVTIAMLGIMPFV
jgi:hypothetical protein